MALTRAVYTLPDTPCAAAGSRALAVIAEHADAFAHRGNALAGRHRRHVAIHRVGIVHAADRIGVIACLHFA
jgi:hypothetical protein